VTSLKRLDYLPGLDGLRALAVAGVIAYHLGILGLPGGYLGVEVFFVVSGYLITSLLAAEWDRSGSIDLKRFWLRRARRLLPAAFLLILATIAFVDLFLPSELAGLRSDALASFAYVTNWYLVFDHKSYFQAIGRPPLLQHLWSLAVEEQFYLAWPLFLTFALRRWSRRRLFFVVLAGALASTLLMARLYQPDVDPTRLYYGTDTRASGLLVGAALALGLRPGESHRGSSASIDALGLLALGTLVGIFVWLGEFNPFLYHGGFLLTATVTAILIAVVAHPRARVLPRLLGSAPLRWVGLRSYSLYLWHWPVLALTRPQIDVPWSGLPLVAGQLVVILALAELSYRFVETPARQGALERGWAALCRAWASLWSARGGRRWWLGLQWLTAAGTVVACASVFGTSVALAQPAAPPAYLTTESVHAVSGPLVAGAAPTPVRRVGTGFTGPKTSATPGTNDASVLPTAPPETVTAIGDSVMVGAAPALAKTVGATDTLEIDARVGRQVDEAIANLRARQAAHQLGDVVVIHVGTNGTFSAEQFDTLMQALAGVHRVVFVNVKVPRTWEGPNNAVIAAGVRRYPNAVLVDWYDASANRPDLFWDDGIHLRPAGAKLYASLIATAVRGGS
jgi:peptidoglycan/LPS O-acetylase OafA/YrhL/lysophospholipase L1-like esterase